MAPLSGRPQDNVWSSFIKLTPNSVFKTTRARCKKCSKEMSSLVKRMKEHLVKCQLEVEDNTNDNIFFKALKAVKAHTMIPLDLDFDAFASFFLECLKPWHLVFQDTNVFQVGIHNADNELFGAIFEFSVVFDVQKHF
ncbi:hypothetical protein QTP88_001715 [Uroleucon formosanum]